MHFLNTIILAGAIFVTATTAAPAPIGSPNCFGVFEGAVSFMHFGCFVV